MAENKSKKDWTGNRQSVYSCMGARNFAEEEREENDYYATNPLAINALFRHEDFSNNIWECACGGGSLSARMERYGKTVKSTDLIDRGYGTGGVDFLKQTDPFPGDIITNPPYKFTTEFILKAYELTQNKVAMFLKLSALEGKERYQKIYKSIPPSDVYVFVDRLGCYKNGKFVDDADIVRGAVCFAWFVWKKNGGGTLPTIHWLPPSDLEDLDEYQTKLF